MVRFSRDGSVRLDPFCFFFAGFSISLPSVSVPATELAGRAEHFRDSAIFYFSIRLLFSIYYWESPYCAGFGTGTRTRWFMYSPCICSVSGTLSARATGGKRFGSVFFSVGLMVFFEEGARVEHVCLNFELEGVDGGLGLDVDHLQ